MPQKMSVDLKTSYSEIKVNKNAHKILTYINNKLQYSDFVSNC